MRCAINISLRSGYTRNENPEWENHLKKKTKLNPSIFGLKKTLCPILYTTKELGKSNHFLILLHGLQAIRDRGKFCFGLVWFYGISNIVGYCYGTVTNLLMDSSKSYINREPSTLVGRSVGRETTPGLLAGPSGIRAGWVLETKSRLGAE